MAMAMVVVVMMVMVMVMVMVVVVMVVVAMAVVAMAAAAMVAAAMAAAAKGVAERAAVMAADGVGEVCWAELRPGGSVDPPEVPRCQHQKGFAHLVALEVQPAHMAQCELPEVVVHTRGVLEVWR